MGLGAGRQACTKAYLSAARCLYAPRTAPSSNHKRAKISEFGLQGVPGLKAAVHGTSLLRSASALGAYVFGILGELGVRRTLGLKEAVAVAFADAWTPIEIRIFEVAIECYGKDFYHVSQVVCVVWCVQQMSEPRDGSSQVLTFRFRCDRPSVACLCSSCDRLGRRRVATSLRCTTSGRKTRSTKL